MGNQSFFGNADIARKLSSQFGTTQKTIKVDKPYIKIIREFIKKVDNAHKNAADSEHQFK